ncbi:hypothetical protein [Streptococcus merionis]|uniref:hypothetical protein n=1 Tax=Streptococcus merionis TaxID=400065 RepID=UPI003512E6EB
MRFSNVKSSDNYTKADRANKNMQSKALPSSGDQLNQNELLYGVVALWLALLLVAMKKKSENEE